MYMYHIIRKSTNQNYTLEPFQVGNIFVSHGCCNKQGLQITEVYFTVVPKARSPKLDIMAGKSVLAVPLDQWFSAGR